MIVIARAVAALALLLAAGVHPVAAQVIDPDGCAAMKEQIRYLTNEGAFIQEAGSKMEWTFWPTRSWRGMRRAERRATTRCPIQ
jgi:hypothetical protein